jgi:ABC-type multidrug transport system fused ATPase/permease subunit
VSTKTSRDVLGRGMRVLGHAIREEPRIFAVAVGGSVLYSLMIIGGAYVVGAIVGELVVPALTSGRVDTGLLAGGAAAVIGISLLRVAGIFGRRLGAGYMQFRLQASYRRRVTRRYLELPLAWHHRHPTGTLLSNANSDVEAAWFPIAPLPFAVGTLVMLAAAMITLFVTDWALALVGVAIFPALFGLNVVYSRRMAPRQTRAQQLRAEVSQIAHESFDGALVVKTTGREDRETARFAAKAGELRDALIAVGRLRGIFDPLLETLSSAGTLLVLLVGAWRLRQGAATVTELVSVTFLFTVLAFPVRAIGWVLGELPRSVAGWDRVQNVLTATGEMAYGTEPATGADAPATLRFEDVTFAYQAGQPVLRDVTFEVPAGRTVALVGPTGSGKSTIAALAARLVDPAAGAVFLDEVDVRRLSSAGLVGTVALVAQVPFVFDDTVRANVALDRPGVDDDRVWGALRLAQADRFVARLPDGLDTAVGERGTSLSGGQRQRLTLARALAGRPRLLVLDDATSAVDPRVEAAILSALRGGTTADGGGADAGGRPPASILVVAYRRATIALADEVVYLEHGRVAGRGTHTELLTTVPGYVDLVTAYEKADAEREQAHAYAEDELALSGGEAP